MDEQDLEEALKAATDALPGSSKFLGRREIKELPSLLWEGERPERLAQGTYNGNGLLVATNRRLLFLDKKLFGGLSVEDFAYDKITSIQYSTGILLGTLTIYASGNKAVIKNVPKEVVRGFGDWLRNRIQQPAPATPVAATPAVSGDPLEQLERAARLRDQGILTEEEFQREKARLIGS